MATLSTPAQAASTPAHQISLLEKLDVVPGLLSIMGSALYAGISSPFRGATGAYTAKQHIGHAAVRKMLRRLNTLQLQYIAEPFSKIYEKWAVSVGMPPELVTLKSGCKAFWMGDHKTAKYIVVYSHGGGFSLDGDDTHIKFWHTVQKDLSAAGISTAFLFIEYSLVPHATYPSQLSQAVEAFNYVRTELKRPASEIMLAGDSAGGNMAVGILSQIMHPTSELPEIKLAEGEKLKALVLVAPWLSFRTDWPSEERNRTKDLVSAWTANLWSTTYLAGRETNPYAEALLAPAEWWKDAPVEQIICTSGSDELLVDSISAWVERYKSVNPDSMTYVIGQHEGHIAPIASPRLGNTAETEQGKAIKSWMKSKL